MKEKQIFGATDGIRAKANEYPLDVTTLVKIGQALAEFTKRYATNHTDRKPEEGYNFGGEFSGHFIFLDYADAGDGTMMALEVMRILKEKKQSLSSLAYKFEKFPQRISNVITKSKPELNGINEIQELLKKWTDKLGDNGRVFLRYSGTENLLRIMVESKDNALLDIISQEFVDVATKALA